MIYDCFTFFNELDLLELRLAELSPVVDRFVIVEANITFSGNKKPFIFAKNRDRFAKYARQIIYIQVKDMNNVPPLSSYLYLSPTVFQLTNPQAWSREIFQRNAIMRGLDHCTNNDIILIGDIDEIPRATRITKLRAVEQTAVLEMSHHYYYWNCIGAEPWLGTKVCKYHQDMIPQQIRDEKDCITVPDAGWHFSFLGGIDIIQTKINSFSHQEHNTSLFTNKNNLKHNIQNALDLFARPYRYKYAKIDKTYPKYLRTNAELRRRYLKRVKRVSENTRWLQETLFQTRSDLYWKQKECEKLQQVLQEYQEKYRRAIKFNPLFYLYTRIFKNP